MRIDDFNADDQYVLIQAHAGADGVTLGLEGNSQRMRDLVGKGTADKDVEEAVTRGIRAGFRKFKLFMITNLPGEEPGDVMRIVELGRRLAAIRDELGQPNVVFQFSCTPLLIEAQTPFQWFAPTPPDHTLIKVAEEFRDLEYPVQNRHQSRAQQGGPVPALPACLPRRRGGDYRRHSRSWTPPAGVACPRTPGTGWRPRCAAAGSATGSRTASMSGQPV